MRYGVLVLLLAIGVGCERHELLFGGTAVAVGGRAAFTGESSTSGCVSGDCRGSSVISDARVRNEDVARVIVGGDGAHEIEGLAEGTARLVADLSIGDASGRARISIPVVEAAAITADFEVDTAGEPTALRVQPGEAFVVRTHLTDADGASVTGEGLHTLHNDDGMLILDEDGASEHHLVAGAVTGTAILSAELTGEPLLAVEIGDAP